MTAKPFGLEQAPVVDRLQRDRALGGQRDMRLPDSPGALAVPLHNDKRRPRIRLEIPEPQTRSGREPKGTIVNDERDGRSMRTAIRAGGSKHAISMTIEERSKPVTSERFRLRPRTPKTRRSHRIARSLHRQQIIHIHPRSGEGKPSRPTYLSSRMRSEALDPGSAIDELNQELERRAATIAPALELPGCGAITAAKLLAEIGPIGRFQTDAQLARHSGVAPLQASSGRVQRHRLDRGGNRQLNCALYRIAITQARYHPQARAYLERKQAEGKSRREAIRCLKRTLIRVVFNTLKASPALT